MKKNLPNFRCIGTKSMYHSSTPNTLEGTIDKEKLEPNTSKKTTKYEYKRQFIPRIKKFKITEWLI